MSENETTTSEPAGEGTAEASPATDEEAIEELSPQEEASGTAELMTAARMRRAELDAMPDGPRPRAPDAQPYKRRKVFVDWQLQVNYVGVYLATATLLTIGFVALNYVFTSFFRRALQIQTQRPFAEHTDAIMLITLNMVFVLLLVIGMAIYAIVQSHRIAGPVLRFRRALHQIHRRDYDFHLQLRSKDYLKDVADQVNGLNNALKHKDIVLTDAALALEEVCKKHPELSGSLEPVTANLLELVKVIPETAVPETEG